MTDEAWRQREQRMEEARRKAEAAQCTRNKSEDTETADHNAQIQVSDAINNKLPESAISKVASRLERSKEEIEPITNDGPYWFQLRSFVISSPKFSTVPSGRIFLALEDDSHLFIPSGMLVCLSFPLFTCHPPTSGRGCLVNQWVKCPQLGPAANINLHVHEIDASQAGLRYKFRMNRGSIDRVTYESLNFTQESLWRFDRNKSHRVRDQITSSSITKGSDNHRESPIKIYILGVQLENGAIMRKILHSDLVQFYSKFRPTCIEDKGVLAKLDVTYYEHIKGEDLNKPMSEYWQFVALLGTPHEPGHEWEFMSENERFDFYSERVPSDGEF